MQTTRSQKAKISNLAKKQKVEWRIIRIMLLLPLGIRARLPYEQIPPINCWSTKYFLKGPTVAISCGWMAPLAGTNTIYNTYI